MKKQKTIWKLDPTSDRYRICPQCQEPHMVNHHARDFCSTKCANDYNNAKKRLDRNAKFVLNSPSYPKDRNQEYTNESQLSSYSILQEDSMLLNSKKLDPELKIILMNNLKELLGEEKEVLVSISELNERKIDLTNYETLERLPNCKLRKASYGDYSVVWVSGEILLLTRQTNLLWTSTH